MKPKRPGPGLVKSKEAPLIERRVRGWVRCTDYRWNELFEAAEVLSEGAVRVEGDGHVYYGSTHIRIPDKLIRGRVSEDDVADLRRLMRSDPHARLRAMRVACLEAQVRSRSEVESVRTEVTFTDEPSAICISVDVEARLAVGKALRSKRTTGNTR